MVHALPSDFRDRPRLSRWWIHLLVLLRIRRVKTVCCESFRKDDRVACKGCPTIYTHESSSWVYRMLAKVAKGKEIK